jgi:S-disulfanyl-L-cysteine oxidoreductase SoxD
MALRKLIFSAAAVLVCQNAWTQSPSYGVGRKATPEEIKSWDISIGPTGKELPPGHGTAKEGAAIYKAKCAGCHGPDGYSKNHAPTLIQSKTPRPREGVVTCLEPCVNDNNTMSVHSPYATVIWDYINRGMPLGREGSLKPDEVYSLTAFLLFRNGVIKEDEVMTEKTLPAVKMPNANGFAVAEWKHGTPRLQGYP